jgi:urease accessory protein
MTEVWPTPLLVWLSPAFPVGSFAYSHGLEWAVDARRIQDLASAHAWLVDLLVTGGVRNDAILMAAAWRAAHDADDGGLIAVNDLALAQAGSRERYLETSAQGNAFMTAVLAAWRTDALARARAALDGDIAYPVGLGLTTAVHGIPLAAALRAYVTAVMSSLVSALVRLSAIGQTDGQRVLAALLPAIERLSADSEQSTLDDLGGAAFLSDIAAMAHETQYTRLFRS